MCIWCFDIIIQRSRLNVANKQKTNKNQKTNCRSDILHSCNEKQDATDATRNLRVSSRAFVIDKHVCWFILITLFNIFKSF
jgi:hypothetical protein